MQYSNPYLDKEANIVRKSNQKRLQSARIAHRITSSHKSLNRNSSNDIMNSNYVVKRPNTADGLYKDKEINYSVVNEFTNNKDSKIIHKSKSTCFKPYQRNISSVESIVKN